MDFGRSSASFTFGVSTTFILDWPKQAQDFEGESLGQLLDNMGDNLAENLGDTLEDSLGDNLGSTWGTDWGQLGGQLGGQLLRQLLGRILKANHLDISFCVSLSVRSFSRKSAT